MAKHQLNRRMYITLTDTAGQGQGLLVKAIINGVVSSSVSFTVTEPISGVYTVNFVPTSTGMWELLVGGQIQYRFRCTEEDEYELLTMIKDASIGSWSLDTSNNLTLYKENGEEWLRYKFDGTSKQLVVT